jgi:hypothetical protein
VFPPEAAPPEAAQETQAAHQVGEIAAGNDPSVLPSRAAAVKLRGAAART